MASERATDPAADGSVEITLGVLNAIEGDSRVTQRSMAQDLGIALGLANAYLKRCVTKGLIKVRQVPPNRYAYYLTPKGFAEKSRLTAEYLSSSLGFFRKAREQCGEALAECEARGWRRIALAGPGELAEITTLCAAERDVALVGIVVAPGVPPAELRGLAGLKTILSAAVPEMADAVLLTEMRSPQEVYERLLGYLPADRVLTPRLLNVSRSTLSGGAVPGEGPSPAAEQRKDAP